ncbi:hypothetical protein HDU93_002814, partial [Gonapodya sp. JEL0774]
MAVVSSLDDSVEQTSNQSEMTGGGADIGPVESKLQLEAAATSEESASGTTNNEKETISTSTGNDPPPVGPPVTMSPNQNATQSSAKPPRIASFASTSALPNVNCLRPRDRLEDFRLVGRLGEGTFSEVLRVKHRVNGAVSAMKRFRKVFKSIEEVESLREIQALRRLAGHPNIIDLEAVIFDPATGVLALNFELMDCNLYELLSRKSHHAGHLKSSDSGSIAASTGGNNFLSDRKIKAYMYQVFRALEIMHGKGIFHRDVKPENILIRGPVAKLADFGSCRGIYSRPPFTEYIATRW